MQNYNETKFTIIFPMRNVKELDIQYKTKPYKLKLRGKLAV